MSDQERRTRSMRDLVDGRDYLVDYYELFHADRDALKGADSAKSESLVKDAYRELNKQYHPDRYAHLSPLLQGQAEQVHRSVVNGYAVLSDPTRRAAYDKKLSEWKGPISTNGFPVYDFSFLSERDRKPLTDEELADAKKFFLQASGYNPNTHAMLKRMVDSDTKGDPELRDAYDESLINMEVFLGIEEHYRWEQAGVAEHPMGEEACSGYLEGIMGRVEEEKTKAPERASALLLEAQSGRLRLLSPDGSDQTLQATADPEAALQRLILAVVKPIEDAAPHLRELATKRQAAYRERLALSMSYRPKQKRLRPKLAVCIDSPHGRPWFAYELQGNQVANITAKAGPLERLAENAAARKRIRSGWNVLYLKVREAFDIRTQLNEAIRKHFNDYLRQEGVDVEE